MIPRPNGASARSIWAHLVEGAGPQNGDYPLDAGDFGRCITFLDANPDLYRDLHRMAEVNAYWAAIWDQWDNLCSIDTKGKDDLLKKILAPIQKADTGHTQIMPGVSMRSGPITFKGADSKEEVFSRAVMAVWEAGGCSTSFIQRKLGIGYNAAARIIERMEELAIVSKPNHVGKRTVRSPDDLRKALGIRAEVMEIAGGDEEQAAVMMRALLDGLRVIETVTPQQEEPHMSGPGHNSGTDAYSVTADELRSFIERAEQLASEKKDIAEQEKELFQEARGRGYDVKVMRKVIALRKRKPDEIAEEEAILDLYRSALGMS